MRVFLALVGALVGVCFSAVAVTNYTIAINPGYNVIANQLNNGGNTLNEVLTNVPDQSILYYYNANTGSLYKPQQYMQGQGWIDVNLNAASTTTLSPGDGAILFNPTASPFNLTFTGNPNSGAQVQQPLGCGVYGLYSRQTNEVGTFENITHNAVQEGSQVYIFNGSGTPLPSLNVANFTAYTYLGGAWSPSLPLIPVGHAAFFQQLCGNTGCISVSATNLYFVSSTFVNVNLSNALSAALGCNVTNILAGYICRPSSGSAFSVGTTPVHALGVDAFGDFSATDFLVTVAPPPVTAPLFTNTIVIHTGTNLIANQFIRGGNNLIEIIPGAPNGSVVMKYDNTTQSWIRSTYRSAIKTWVPGNVTLNPGEGALFVSPTSFALNFSGVTPTPNLPITLNGIELLSLQTNGTGRYENIIGQNPGSGATVYTLDPSGAYNSYTYDAPKKVWHDQSNNLVAEPTTLPAQSCWISPALTTPPVPPSPPIILIQPTNVVGAVGQIASFSVTAAGSGLHYNWRHNGQIVSLNGKSAYSVVGFQPTNAGIYSVDVYNSIGLVSSSNAVLTPGNLPAVTFSDNFAAATDLGSTSSGSFVSSNVNATFEKGEPFPGNIPAGASVWVRWIAPSTGVATFNLAGSSFDTLIGVYTGQNFKNLVPVVFDDDNASFQNSVVSFNTVGQATYFIQISGFYGATGQIVLSYNLINKDIFLPVILQQPTNVTTTAGGTAIFSVITQPGKPVSYQWIRDGNSIGGATQPTLTITNVSEKVIGTYQVIITNLAGGMSITSFPAELQFNSSVSGGVTNIDPLTRALDKFLAASDSTIRPGDPYDPDIVTGYTATQVFGTYGSGVDANEPLHCGTSCTFTKWNAYAAPSAGLVTVQNSGTSFSGVLAVYSGPPTNYATLSPIACSAGHTAGNEIVSFEATGATTYWVMMGGTNVTSGTVRLQYSTTTPPFFTLLPISQGVDQGSNVTLTTTTSGNPPPTYQWQLNGTNIPGAVRSSLAMTGFNYTNQGKYTVVAANIYGTNTFSYASVYVDAPLQFANMTNTSSNFFTQLYGVANSNYDIQVSSDLQNWTTVQSGSSSTGIQNYTETNGHSPSNRLFRAMVTKIPR